MEPDQERIIPSSAWLWFEQIHSSTHQFHDKAEHQSLLMVDLLTRSSLQCAGCVCLAAALIQQVRAGEGPALAPNQPVCDAASSTFPLAVRQRGPIVVGLQVSAGGTCSLCSPFPPADCKSSAPKLSVAFLYHLNF